MGRLVATAWKTPWVSGWVGPDATRGRAGFRRSVGRSAAAAMMICSSWRRSGGGAPIVSGDDDTAGAGRYGRSVPAWTGSVSGRVRAVAPARANLWVAAFLLAATEVQLWVS